MKEAAGQSGQQNQDGQQDEAGQKIHRNQNQLGKTDQAGQNDQNGQQDGVGQKNQNPSLTRQIIASTAAQKEEYARSSTGATPWVCASLTVRVLGLLGSVEIAWM